jgi:hypothetical protein
VEVLEFRDSSKFDIAVRDGTPEGWDRLAHICGVNQALWKSQRPPVRVAHVSRDIGLTAGTESVP